MAKSAKMKLPWNKTEIISAGLDGSLFYCDVKNSLLPNAGNGRFSKKYIPQQSIVVRKKIISVYDDNIWDHDKVIIIQNVHELNHLIDIFSKTFNKTKTEIINCLCNYIGCIDDKLYLHTTSIHDNHSKNPNMCCIFEKEYFIYKSIKNIRKGDELYINYQQLTYPLFYKEFCAQNNVKDLTLAAKQFDAIYLPNDSKSKI
eukprot:70029_1